MKCIILVAVMSFTALSCNNSGSEDNGTFDSVGTSSSGNSTGGTTTDTSTYNNRDTGSSPDKSGRDSVPQ